MQIDPSAICFTHKKKATHICLDYNCKHETRISCEICKEEFHAKKHSSLLITPIDNQDGYIHLYQEYSQKFKYLSEFQKTLNSNQLMNQIELFFQGLQRKIQETLQDLLLDTKQIFQEELTKQRDSLEQLQHINSQMKFIYKDHQKASEDVEQEYRQFLMSFQEEMNNLEQKHDYFLEEFSNYYFFCQELEQYNKKEMCQVEQNIIHQMIKDIRQYISPIKFELVNSKKYPFNIVTCSDQNLKFEQQITSIQKQLLGMVYSNISFTPHIEYQLEFQLNQTLPEHTVIGLCPSKFLDGELWPQQNIHKVLCCSRFKEGVNNEVKGNDFQGQIKKGETFKVRVCIQKDLFQIEYKDNIVNSEINLQSLVTKDSKDFHLFIAMKQSHGTDKPFSITLLSKNISLQLQDS